MRPIHAVFLALLLLAPPLAFAQSGAAPGIEISGELVTKVTLTRADLVKLPAIEMDVEFMTSKGKEKARYKGALLWQIFEDNGLKDLKGHHEELKHTFLVTASDDYRIAFSFGEIAPDFGSRQVLIAYERDGKELADGNLRIVVPGDTRGARSVRDVVKIEVK